MLAATLLHRLSRGIAGYGVAVAATLAATGAIEALDHFIRIPNASLLYLPAILISAVSFGTGPSLAAATLAVLQYDFFLLQPIHTLTIGRAEDILAFVVFLIVALITSQLAGRARQRAEAAQRRAREGSTLYELGQALMSTHDVEELLHAVTERVVEVFRVDRSTIF